MYSKGDESLIYRPEQSRIDTDGNISVPASHWGRNGVQTTVEVISTVDSEAYPFWRWLVLHPEYQRLLNVTELNYAKDRFKEESDQPGVTKRP